MFPLVAPTFHGRFNHALNGGRAMIQRVDTSQWRGDDFRRGTMIVTASAAGTPIAVVYSPMLALPETCEECHAAYRGTGDDMTDDTEIIYSPLAGRSFTFQGDTLVSMGPKNDDTAPYADCGGKWDAPWSPEFQAEIDRAATITHCEKCSKKLIPDESIICFECADASRVESLTVACPECGTSFDVANPDFWDAVRDHACSVPPMEYFVWDSEYDLDNMQAWHLYPTSNAPEKIQKYGCVACLFQTIDGHVVVFCQSERMQEFLTVDDAKNFVSWKIDSGTWPMHER